MKLLGKDFQQIMKTYKTIKTVCKSQNNQVTLGDRYARVDIFGEDIHSQVILDVEPESYEKDINLNSECLEKFVKIKVKDSVEVNEQMKIDGRVLPYQTSEEPVDLIDTSEFIEVFKCNAGEFKEALKAVKVAVSKETSRPVLTNVLLDVNTLVAVDGYRIFTRILNSTDSANLLIKPHTVEILVKLLPTKGDEVLTIYKSSNEYCVNYCVKFGPYKIIDSAGEGEFLKWKQVLNNDSNYTLTCSREELLDELQFAIDYAGPSNKALVKISLKEDEIVIGEKSLVAEYSKHEGAPGKHFNELTLAFNTRYLLESLKSYKGELVTLRFISALTPVIINDLDLILPIRLKD